MGNAHFMIMTPLQEAAVPLPQHTTQAIPGEGARQVG